MKKFHLIPLVIILFGVLFTTACEDDDAEDDLDLTTIAYTLRSTEEAKTADIEYTSGIGPIRLEDVPLPWSISFIAIYRTGDELYFQAESGDQGEMTGKIILDDEEVASETATHLIQLNYIKGLK